MWRWWSPDGTRDVSLFGDKKPLIAMAHLRALPGTPLYDEKAGVAGIVEHLRADLEIILAADFDAVLFCNEGDLPYSFKAGYDGVADHDPRGHRAGAQGPAVRGRLPLGPARGAQHRRGHRRIVHPLRAGRAPTRSDMGLWSTDVAGLLRERRRIGADHVAMFMNVTPEFASSLGTRSVTEVARSAVWSSLADAILISGPRQGVEPDMDALAQVKEALGERGAGDRQHGRQVHQRGLVPGEGRRHHRRLRPQARRLHLERGRRRPRRGAS